MDSVLFLLIAVTLHRLDILVHVGEARGLTEHNPSATEWDESCHYILLLSPLSVRVGVYPDLVTGEVTVGVQVGGAARLHPDHVHVIAIWPGRREPSEPDLSLGNVQLPAAGAGRAVVGDGAGGPLDVGAGGARPLVNHGGHLLLSLDKNVLDLDFNLGAFLTPPPSRMRESQCLGRKPPWSPRPWRSLVQSAARW